MWSHGPDELSDFLNHLNSIHQCIQFSKETETESHLPFLNIGIHRRPDGSLSLRMYRKLTDTNLYLNAGPRHHPTNKQAMLSTLVHRARALCDEGSVHAELVFLRNVFRQTNRFSVLNRHPNISKPDDKPNSVAFLPCAVPIFNRISRVLAQHITMSVSLPHKKIYSLPRLVKDNLGLRTPGVYIIPCECGKVCIGQTDCCDDTGLKDHQRHIRLEHPDKSAVCEHTVDSGHRILFHDTSILATKTRHMDRIVREAIEIELHPNI
jgi:hypothetical protein